MLRRDRPFTSTSSSGSGASSSVRRPARVRRVPGGGRPGAAAGVARRTGGWSRAQVWLNLIPVLNFVWMLVTVERVGGVDPQRADRRGRDRKGEGYGKTVGRPAWCCSLPLAVPPVAVVTWPFAAGVRDGVLGATGRVRPRLRRAVADPLRRGVVTTARARTRRLPMTAMTAATDDMRRSPPRRALVRPRRRSTDDTRRRLSAAARSMCRSARSWNSCSSSAWWPSCWRYRLVLASSSCCDRRRPCEPVQSRRTGTMEPGHGVAEPDPVLEHRLGSSSP